MKRLARVLGVLLALVMSPAQAAYPDHPIKVVNGFAAGGGSDILLRTIIPAISENLGQQIIVEYRTGAGGNLAMEAVAKAAPDGYTLLMGTPGLATNPSLYANLPFDPQKAFAPISLVGTVPNVLVVNPELPAKSVSELVALAKRTPGKLNYASPGVGTSLHLAGELFKLDTGTDIVHVAYKGGSQAQTDVMGGQVQMMFNVLPSALPQIQAGKLRALAVTSTTRAASLPDVPTMVEAGVPGYSAITWNGLLAPAGTPPEVIARLNDAIVKAMRSPDMKALLTKIGQDPAWSTPEEFASFLRDETAKWTKVIKATGIQPQ
ncbi:MAG TPA: tripartite tricarboxylate transporter substrate binding protein [Casimicrobiaceae bacterium]|jgi:tripartite-type tricarboxylate transporter receptor subunit TctC|nr:tripartite tricarboxylate transporter substrate binding protein [Casimicrobiaceae bacterium]